MTEQRGNVSLHIDYHDYRTGSIWSNYIDHMSHTKQVTYKMSGTTKETQGPEETNTTGDTTNGTTKYKSNSSKKLPVIRLQKILFMQEESSIYCEEDKDDEAYGLLNKQYKLGAEVSFIPVLINYYKVLIKTDRGEESQKAVEDLVILIREKLKSTPTECELMGDIYRNDKEYLKAILFYKIAGKLVRSRPITDKIVNVLQGCLLGMKLCIMKIMKHHSNLRHLVNTNFIPSMKTLTQLIHNSGDGDRKAICLIEVICLHHIEICEGLVGDFDASEATLKHSIYLMDSTLKEERHKHQLYGTALNNLGATYLQKRMPHEAIECLKKAIDANMNAEDFRTSEERGEDVDRSMSVISKCEEMIKDMEIS